MVPIRKILGGNLQPMFLPNLKTNGQELRPLKRTIHIIKCQSKIVLGIRVGVYLMVLVNNSELIGWSSEFINFPMNKFAYKLVCYELNLFEE